MFHILMAFASACVEHVYYGRAAASFFQLQIGCNVKFVRNFFNNFKISWEYILGVYLGNLSWILSWIFLSANSSSSSPIFVKPVFESNSDNSSIIIMCQYLILFNNYITFRKREVKLMTIPRTIT